MSIGRRLSGILGAVLIVGGVLTACQGPVGLQGERGPQGWPGAAPTEEQLRALVEQAVTKHAAELKGPQGERGLQGQPGPQGERGLQGPAGPQGERGAQGAQGLPGPRGLQGPPGDTANVSDLETEVYGYQGSKSPADTDRRVSRIDNLEDEVYGYLGFDWSSRIDKLVSRIDTLESDISALRNRVFVLELYSHRHY